MSESVVDNDFICSSYQQSKCYPSQMKELRLREREGGPVHKVRKGIKGHETAWPPDIPGLGWHFCSQLRLNIPARLRAVQHAARHAAGIQETSVGPN